MTIQPSIIIQNNAALKPEIQSQQDRKTDNQEERFNKLFQTSLNEKIIDVYERPEINTAVPDERSGVDRRTSAPRRKSSAKSVPFTSGRVNVETGINSTKQTYITIEKNTSDLLNQKKGGFLDIWV